MRRAPAPLAVLLLAALAGCDAASEPVLEAERRASFDVAYAVEGTYARCSVTYADASGARTLDTALPWRVRVRAEATSATPFHASVSATCTDEVREGKGTVSIRANDVLRDLRTTAGRGATALATATLEVD